MYPFRFKMILIIFFLLFTGIVVRLFQLQIIESDKYKGISKTRRLTSYALDSIRGSIVDRHGNVLAVDHHTFDITVQYKNLLYCAITYKNKTISRIPEMEVHKKTKKSCKECHEKQDVWLKKLSQLLNIQPEKLLEGTNQIIERVEKLKQNIEKNMAGPFASRRKRTFTPLLPMLPGKRLFK